MNSSARQPEVPDPAASRKPPLWLWLLASLPYPLLHALAATLAWIARVPLRFRVRYGRENLQRCFPAMTQRELRRAMARHYRAIADTVLEMTKLATMSEAELRERVTLRGAELVHAELAAGRSVMLLSAHQGNWEWLLQRAVVEFRSTPHFGAYKPLRNARFDRDLLWLRQRFGARLVAAKGLIRPLLRVKGPHAVAMLADQVPLTSPSRIWLPFMGQQTAFYPGPAEMARRFGYSSFFFSMRPTGPARYAVTAQPLALASEEVSVEEFTRRYAAMLEEQLRERPWDWAWGHRRWKIAPPAAG